jgi:hypothetical protein
MWISPNYRTTDFQLPLTLEQKISLFEDRTIGWQLGIANRVANGSATSAGQPDENAVQHSGYAVLNIVLSYFEMIAKFRAGFIGAGQSSQFFKEGVRQVFPQLGAFPLVVVDGLLDALYSGGRCGLYHGGMTDARIMLTGGLNAAMAYDPQGEHLAINPHQLPPALLAHFQTYIGELRNTANAALRSNFVNRFNAETQ